MTRQRVATSRSSQRLGGEAPPPTSHLLFSKPSCRRSTTAIVTATRQEQQEEQQQQYSSSNRNSKIWPKENQWTIMKNLEHAMNMQDNFMGKQGKPIKKEHVGKMQENQWKSKEDHKKSTNKWRKWRKTNGKWGKLRKMKGTPLQTESQ